MNNNNKSTKPNKTSCSNKKKTETEKKNQKVKKTTTIFIHKQKKKSKDKKIQMYTQGHTLKKWDQNFILFEHPLENHFNFSENFGDLTIKEFLTLYQYETKRAHETRDRITKTTQVVRESKSNNTNYQPNKDDWERVSNSSRSGGWIFNDKKILKRQKSAIWDLVKGPAKNLFKKNVDVSCSFCLPVSLFEPRSYLERLVDNYAFAPYFIRLATETTNPIERMKLFICTVISSLHLTTKQLKPFNPILGETYQGFFPDGTKIYCEQISHHPPISAWEFIGPDNSYYLHGTGHWKASFKGYAVQGGQIGKTTLKFPDGNEIVFAKGPTVWVKGLVWGDRIIEYKDSAIFYDLKNKLYCKLDFDLDKTGWTKNLFHSKLPSDMFRGNIIKMDDEDELDSNYELKSLHKKKGKKNYENTEHEILSKVNGSWVGRLDFDNFTYFSLKNDIEIKPILPIAIKKPLPSDSRFRTDLLNLKKGDIKQSDIAKVELEMRQRNDRKLRKKAQKKKKGIKKKKKKLVNKKKKNLKEKKIFKKKKHLNEKKNLKEMKK
ncbi:oxysterol-binding protein [Anaeramoeba flamelloides]|uniref:Oxysterol-binding protein n=1 Tax=Anaeramoeba flamelloides TaxID=1746091 RepID=A0ABQ8YX27_9EUKA|nr:oxysterol-binding protein [Anaeramoeba flamelloides]